MKISTDDIELYTLSNHHEDVIKHTISSDIFEDDMKRRLEWVLMHLYERSFKQLKEQWEPKLAERGVQSIPTDPTAFADLVFSQPDYKDRKAQDEASIL